MTPDALAALGPDRWSVRMERHYPHPVAKVWRAVSDPVHLSRWFPAPVDLAAEVGSEVRFGAPAEGEPALTGVVTECEPPHLLAFTWDTDHLRFELAPVDGGTTLVLLHAFDDRAGAASFGAGWGACFPVLAADLAGQPAPPATRAERRHEELAAAFGLDAPAVDEVDAEGRWRIVFERQTVAPREVVWGLLLGVDADGAPRREPAVGEPMTPGRAPEHVLGTVTEVVPGEVLAWSCAPGEPGDAVRLSFAEGTGHGARVVVTITGTDPSERAAARSGWHDGVEATAAAALEAALAGAP